MTESMHGCTILCSSDHPDCLHMDWSTMIESFQPWRTHDSKKYSSLAMKFPLATDSVMRRNFAADSAATKLWALRLMVMP